MMRSALNKITPWLWTAVWFTLPVSMKANALSLILFGLASLVRAVYDKPAVSRSQFILPGLFILYFAWHAASLLFDPAQHEVWKSLEKKISLVAIPLVMLLVTGADWSPGKWALRGFFAGLTITGLHMLALAFLQIARGNPIDSFTHHAFTGPYYTGAIYYSWYVSSALFILAFGKSEPFIRRFSLPLSVFLMILLFFCASKLFIILTVPLVLWKFIRDQFRNRSRKRYLAFALVMTLIVLGSIPFAGRIAELKNTDLRVVRQAEYTYDTPWNGLTFRLLLWRLAGEIMHDHQAWLTGTGIGSRQQVLNSYYTQYGIYTGNPDLGDSGYLGYNFHNQYLEVMTGTGIPGLLLLIIIIIFIFKAEKRKRLFPLAVYLALIIFFFTESVLERQAGMVFFCLIWTFRVPDAENMTT